MSGDSSIPRAYYLLGLIGFSAAFVTWLSSRMDGWVFFAACLYVLLGGVYLLLRWNFGPWSTTAAQSKLNQAQVRALTGAHFTVLGALVAVIISLISANELGKWVPDFTEKQIRSEAPAWKGVATPIKASLVAGPPILEKAGVVGVVKGADGEVLLVMLKPFIADTSDAILKRITDFALTIIVIPFLGIPALKLFEVLFSDR
jgi:hypothetical protein